MLPVEQPFKTYTGLDGKPLNNGCVYFGLPGQDPIAHPVTVYWDAAGTLPAPQELRTVNGYIVNAGTPANVFFDGPYSELVKDSKGRQVFYARSSDDFSIATLVQSLFQPSGADKMKFTPAGDGAVPTSVQDQLREIVSLKNYGVLGDGSDETAKFQKAVTAAAGKTLRGESGKTYLLRDTITVPSNVTLDMRGAAISDGVQGFWPSSDAGRAKPLFFIYGVDNVCIKNLVYSATADRSTLNDTGVPTAIFWIGDNRGGTDATRNISIKSISASNLAGGSLFVSITGNAFDIDVSKIQITGSCSYGINIEYGRAPTDTDSYGLHPYNIMVKQFNGYDNAVSVGFLRVASCYNVKFLNCYGKNVAFFIYAWTGDRSISRVSENVTFENCVHYAGSDFLPGVINYVAQILSVSQDGSTGDPLPSWTNYDHLFQFRGCQFQNNKVQYSTCVRYYGTQGIALIEACILQGSYYAVLAQPTASVGYTSNGALSIRDTIFKQNTQDIVVNAMRSILIDHCQFTAPDGTAIPVSFIGSAYYSKILNSHFSGMPTDIAWVSIAAGCDYNEISGNVFEDSGGTGSAPPLELMSPTFGLGNSNRYSAQGLAKQGDAYYGVIGEPSTMDFDLAGLSGTSVDCKKKTSYVALTGAVNVTVSSILNGDLGDTVLFRSVSSLATVTFVDNDATAGTSNRILTPATGNLVKTGSRWSMTAYRTSTGWLLS